MTKCFSRKYRERRWVETLFRIVLQITVLCIKKSISQTPDIRSLGLASSVKSWQRRRVVMFRISSLGVKRCWLWCSGSVHSRSSMIECRRRRRRSSMLFVELSRQSDDILAVRRRRRVYTDGCSALGVACRRHLLVMWCSGD